MMLAWLAIMSSQVIPAVAGPWRAALDLAGGTLKFRVEVEAAGTALSGKLCNGQQCDAFSSVLVQGDSVRFELADYAATITAAVRGDSLVGYYRNVGNRGPRVISFRASRGVWPVSAAPAWLAGRWYALFRGSVGDTPRIFEFRNGPAGLEGTIIGNSGDYSHFSGEAMRDSFALSRFDGSFVYLLAGSLEGDTLRGTFHAGLKAQTPFVAVRAQGPSPLKPPTAVTRADTTAPFRFAFRDVNGALVQSDDRQFRGKVVVVDAFGTWCPTCHEAAPALVNLYRSRHAQGLEVVGLAYEVSGDTAVDGALVRRYRDKFGIPFPLLLAGTNDVDAAAATLPQLQGFTAFPTTIFIGRDGRVRRVHAGFYGPATGPQHGALIAAFADEVDRLLSEPVPPQVP
jgi:thiol-disulfide isomerase/thioredoxin